MAGASDLAPLLTGGDPPDVGFRQGILASYNTSTGTNTVLIAGQMFEDLPMLASGTLAMAPGDQIALLRFGSTYFILGVIRAAGVGTLATRAATVAAQQSTSSATYIDLATVGPTLTDVYIGPSRQCLVLLNASAGILNGVAAMDFEVSGASSISPSSNATNAAFIGVTTEGAQAIASVSSGTLLTAASGLNEGLNTFTAKYARTQTGAGATGAATFADRVLTVIPF